MAQDTTASPEQEAYEWVVVQGDPNDAEAVEPCLVDACYNDRDPYGEYILFAAANPEALSGDKININDYAYLAEAHVLFEEDLLEDARSDIAWCQEDAEDQGEGFVLDVWPSWQDVSPTVVANTIFPPDQDFVMAKSVLASGEDSCAWLEMTRIEADMPPEMALNFCKIEQNRLLEVKAVLKDADVPIYVMADFWSQMVQLFQDLPYKALTGAQRVEPELEEFDFSDFDDEDLDEKSLN